MELKQLLLKRKEFRSVNIDGVELDEPKKRKIGRKGESNALTIPKEYEKYGFLRGVICEIIPVAWPRKFTDTILYIRIPSRKKQEEVKTEDE